MSNTNNSVNVGLSGSTGTGNFVGATSTTLVTPNIGVATYTSLQPAVNGEGLVDSQGQLALSVLAGTSSVNGTSITTATTGNAPAITAIGTDTNVHMAFLGQGTGGAIVQGITSGSTPATGFIGEIVSSQILAASAVSLTTSTPKNITSISLTAGNWLINGNVFFNFSSSAPGTLIAWISTSSATTVDNSKWNVLVFTATGAVSNFGMSAPTFPLSISSTTTVYLEGFAAFSAGTGTGCGGIFAIRIG